MNEERNNQSQPRTFKPGVCYISTAVIWGGHGYEETIFLVIKPSDKHWNRWANPHPVQYHALNLITGEEFEFHRDSHVADYAKELIT